MPAEAVVSGIYDVRLGKQCAEIIGIPGLVPDQPIQDGRYKPVAFQAEHRFTARTENCIMNTMDGVLTWTPKRCSAAIAPDTFHSVYSFN